MSDAHDKMVSDMVLDYANRPCDSDAWGLTVVGLPRQQRHESGKGFKPVQAGYWDYNCPWLGEEGRGGYKLDWLPEPDVAAVGDVILLYDDPGYTGTFGFLYRIVSISGDGWAKVESASPIRFQAHTDEEFDAEHPTFPAHGASSKIPDDWGKRNGYETCPHMAPTTSGAAARIRVTCSACAEAKDAPR